jgi:hypothetical protein
MSSPNVAKNKCECNPGFYEDDNDGICKVGQICENGTVFNKTTLNC